MRVSIRFGLARIPFRERWNDRFPIADKKDKVSMPPGVFLTGMLTPMAISALAWSRFIFTDEMSLTDERALSTVAAQPEQVIPETEYVCVILIMQFVMNKKSQRKISNFG